MTQATGDPGSERSKENMAVEGDFERWKAREELDIKRQELEIKRQESAKHLWSSPLVLAVIGLMATILGSMVQNYFQNRATREIEKGRFETALIQKASETSDPSEAAKRLKFYVDLGFLNDADHKISDYVNRPDDIPLQPAEPATTGDVYTGVFRKGAKLSIGTGPVAQYGSLRELLSSLPSDQLMQARNPPITSTTPRIDIEQRNIRVSGYIYAAKREPSNDYHVILGGSPDAEDTEYIIAVVAGLPDSQQPTYEKLRTVREVFVQSLGQRLAPLRYTRFPEPIAADIEGSIFFDNSHIAGMIGPANLRPKTRWEIRPITKFSLRQ